MRLLSFRSAKIKQFSAITAMVMLAMLIGGIAHSEEFGESLAEEMFGSEHSHVCRYCEGCRNRAMADESSAGPFSAASDEEGRKYAPDRIVDVLHIKLDVTPNFEDHTIGGTTTIKFTPISRPVKELRLDAVHLTISAVRGSSEVADFVSADQDLTIVFAEEIPVGKESWVEIDHSAQPDRGFYFRTPEMGYPETDTHVWTQGETHEARHWFPCFDYPNERSSTEVICHVPSDMTVLSNGKRMSEEFDKETKLKAVRWLHEKPHVNYLICLVAGYLDKLEDKHRDVPLAFYSQPSLSEHAPNSFVDTAKIMAFFEEEIGVEYPWNKYYQVTIRDFTAGGMENTTLTTLTHSTIFSAATENIKSTRSLDAHEMAHQWFGDYVTCKDWSHLWLNEGFATYYSLLYEGHKFGPDALKYGLYRDARNRVLPRGKKNRNPIVYKDYKNPGEQFDFRAYPKGSWVLHMLRNQLGEDLYRKSIKMYLEQHALSSVVTEELNAVLESVSGRSLDRFFDQWVYHGGHPELTVSYRWQAADQLAKVTVAQTQKVDDEVMLFHFPTKLRFELEDGTVVDREIEIRDQLQEFYVRLPDNPKVVRFDPDFSVLAEVAFKKSDDMLLAQLENKSDVIGRLLAIEGLEKRKTLKSVAALKAALQGDEFFGVRIKAASALRKIDTDESFEALTDSQEQENAKVRFAVIEEIGRFYRPESRDALLATIEKDSNPAIVSKAIRALGKFDEPKVVDVLRRSLRNESFNNQVAAAAISALGDRANPDDAKELFKVLKDRRKDLSRGGVAIGLSVLGKLAKDGDQQDDVREYLLDIVRDVDSNHRTSAIRALGSLGDKRAKAVLKSLVNDDSKSRVAAVAKSALESIDSGSPLVPKEVLEMRKQLAELRAAQEDLEEQVERMKKQNSQPKLGTPMEASRDGAAKNTWVADKAGDSESTGKDAIVDQDGVKKDRPGKKRKAGKKKTKPQPTE